jgi:hypothetical protein
MERHKIESFELEHGVGSFPAFRSVEKEEYGYLVCRLKLLCGIEYTERDSVLFRDVLYGGAVELEMEHGGRVVDGKELFSLLSVALDGDSYVIWDDRHGGVYRMATNDVCRTIADLWNPGADDVIIVDCSYRSVVAIGHDGLVRRKYL